MTDFIMIFALLVGFIYGGSLLTKATLQPLWSFLNSLTILLHIVMLNIQVPAEVSYQASQLIYFSRFSFMASSDEYWALDPRDINLESIQYQSGYGHYGIWQNMGIITDVILVLFFLTMCAMILDAVTCCYCCRKKAHLKFSEINIRLQIQAYLEMVLCICINLKGSEHWSFTNQIGILIYLLLTIRLLILSCYTEKIFTNNPDNTLVLGLNPKRPEKVSQYL